MLSCSEWSRPAKLSQAACRLLKVGGDRVSAEGWTVVRRGAVLGRPNARAPKVPPKTVGPRRGEWFLGEPAGGGLILLPCQRTTTLSDTGEECLKGRWGRNIPRETYTLFSCLSPPHPPSGCCMSSRITPSPLVSTRCCERKYPCFVLPVAPQDAIIKVPNIHVMRDARQKIIT